MIGHSICLAEMCEFLWRLLELLTNTCGSQWSEIASVLRKSRLQWGGNWVSAENRRVLLIDNQKPLNEIWDVLKHMNDFPKNATMSWERHRLSYTSVCFCVTHTEVPEELIALYLENDPCIMKPYSKCFISLRLPLAAEENHHVLKATNAFLKEAQHLFKKCWFLKRTTLFLSIPTISIWKSQESRSDAFCLITCLW